MKKFEYPNVYLMAIVDEMNNGITNYIEDMDEINISYNKTVISAMEDFRDTLVSHVVLMDKYRQTFRNDKHPDRSAVKMAINMIRHNFETSVKSTYITTNPIYKNVMNQLITRAYKIIIEVHRELYDK